MVKCSRLCCALVLATKGASSAGSAADRAVLSAVTPDTLGLGEEVKIRWNYDDGNGGEGDMVTYHKVKPWSSLLCSALLLEMLVL